MTLAIVSVFDNISQPNFAFLLILVCSFRGYTLLVYNGIVYWFVLLTTPCLFQVFIRAYMHGKVKMNENIAFTFVYHET